VNIREAERYLGDYILDRSNLFYTSPAKDTDLSVAVVGSGPSGLTAVHTPGETLVQLNIECVFISDISLSEKLTGRSGPRSWTVATVYKALEKPGGMLRYSLPAYRLPEETVDRTVAAFENMGIVFWCGDRVDQGRLSELKHTCDAVYVSTGAWESVSLPVEGGDLAVSALELLKRVRQGLRNPGGRRVAVIGGGNVAVGTAVTARRLGAEQVILVCLEPRDGMPADEAEVNQAEEEGFMVIPSRGVTCICRLPDDSYRLDLVRGTAVFDEEGRFAPQYDRNDTESLEADAVFAAVGQRADISFLPQGIRDKDGRLTVDADSGRTGIPGLYAGGDLLEPANAIDAVAAAARAAGSIMADLGVVVEEEDDTVGPRRFLPFDPQVLSLKLSMELEPVTPAERTVDREDTGTLRYGDLEDGIKRCMNCGCVAVNPSDMGTVLTALDAIILTSERALPVEDFFDCTEKSSTVLRPGEIVTAVQLPEPKPGSRAVCLKYRERQAIDFPVVGVAVRLDVEDDTITDARVCLGAPAAFPVRARTAGEYLLGKRTAESAAPLKDPASVPPDDTDTLPCSRAASLALKGMAALPENAYKIRLFRAYVRRAVHACLEERIG